MRLLVASDWHLGRLFHGTHLTDDQAFVLEQFLTLARESRAEAVLIAGDVFDRAVPPPEAVQLLDETLARLILDVKVPVILIAGNHDSPIRLGFGAEVMAGSGLYVRGSYTGIDRPIILEDKFGPLAVLPFPFAEPALVRRKLGGDDNFDQQAALKARTQAWAPALSPEPTRSIALAHVFVAGGTASDSERPLSLGGQETVEPEVFANFNFTVLGHLHRPQAAAAGNIIYPGSLLKYSFSEIKDKKSVCLLEIDARGSTRVERIPLSPRRDMRKIEGSFDEIMAGPGPGESKDDYILISLRDKGPILDAVGRIREIYPNVLHLERPFLTAPDHDRPPTGDHRRLGELDLFRSFFHYAAGEALSDAEEEVLVESLSALSRLEREN
ncbi:MAG: exonuclease SbcCD subunit D [Pseudomonadota bacterium]